MSKRPTKQDRLMFMDQNNLKLAIRGQVVRLTGSGAGEALFNDIAQRTAQDWTIRLALDESTKVDEL